MLAVAVVILAGVVVVASGRGGEMAYDDPDYPPIDLGPVTAADVALLRPPSAAWGYNMRVTDQALEVIARAVTERDIQISALQQEVADLRERASPGWAATGAPHSAPGLAAQAQGPAEAKAEADTGAAGADTAEPSWPADEPAPGSVPVTRPQPVYRDTGARGTGATDTGATGVGARDTGAQDTGARDTGDLGEPHQQAAWPGPGGPGTEPGGASQQHDSPGGTFGQHVTWEAPSRPSVWDTASQPGSAHDTPGAAAAPWQAAPQPSVRDTASQPGSAHDTPGAAAAPWQAAPQPSVWDTASHPEPARETAAEAEPGWDEAPHQQLVWGSANQQAKAAHAAGQAETPPHSPAPHSPGQGAGQDVPGRYQYELPPGQEVPGQYRYEIPGQYWTEPASPGPEEDRE